MSNCDGNNKYATTENHKADISVRILKENMLTFFRKKNYYLVCIYSKVQLKE